jgi:uncharacterized protein
MPIRITAGQARRLVLGLQGLADPPRRKLDADDLLALIERLGFVQVDSVNVVARAHHMILFARNQTYRPALLQRLLEREARLFENWTHDAAIIPTRFYPYWRVRFERDRARLAQRYRQWFGGQHEERVEAMLAHVRQNGAVMARDVGERARPRGGFWDWHPDKAALELLWRTGHLTIARRQNFQKVYDLAERVIPAAARAGTPSHEAFVDWACGSALQRLGFATPAQLAGFWGLVTLAEARQWCAAHPDRAVPAALEPADGSAPRPVFARGRHRGAAPGAAGVPRPGACAEPLRSLAARSQTAACAVQLRLSDRDLRARQPAPLWLLRLSAARGGAADRPDRHAAEHHRAPARGDGALAGAGAAPEPEPR